ncbi:hypothetical protein CKO11_04825 [Rhodobacter sp. TJ_12]|uniref:CheR family methyltransferase n=1 Tax=Rhodobacter sp. TJ_12 TaxID=2029399 RepID=UPI001CBFF63D|nr:CheR family methyltransferase [Rhodobacter sp. TJ_12]MBZ4021783.1 hypothetical protein [Rhodobacter sp. TJ_12]
MAQRATGATPGQNSKGAAASQKQENAAPDAIAAPDEVTALVAIGASAGGLEPLERLFSAVRADTGWCFVVIQHLSPDYRSMMHELLGRKTRLKIRHIEEGARPEPNTIFLNRPNTATELVDGAFRVREYDARDENPHLPIDRFFTSLIGRDMKRTIAVILSGSGSDGTRGAQNLHVAGGRVIAQLPAEAAFPSMPQSAIATNVVDHVFMAGAIPDAIGTLLEASDPARPDVGGSEPGSVQQILKLLEDHHALDFSHYKSENVLRRIQRRQHLRGLATLEEYLAQMLVDSEAIDELYRDLLIGVTAFYRDPDAFDALRKQAIAQLVERSSQDKPLRVWVAGCASGEEAYTIAIELSEALIAANKPLNFRVIATDVHRHSLDIASAGIYSNDQVRKVPQALRDRYFTCGQNGWAVTHELRQRVIFSVHNALTDPPFLDLDLISCRNLLIYLNDEAQARTLSLFLFGLQRNGFLFLGSSESLGRFSEEFETIETRWRLFRKSSSKRLYDPALLAATISRRVNRPYQEALNNVPVSASGLPAADGGLRDLAARRSRDALMRSYDLLLKHYAPSSILVTSDGDVLNWFGTASILIDTMNNLADWTVEGIVNADLHFVINVGIEKLRSGELVELTRQIDVNLGDGRIQPCTLTLESLDVSPAKPRLMLVKLRLENEAERHEPDLAQGLPVVQEDFNVLTRRIYELERDLKLTEETLQHVTERLEASGEELQASNEELQASNEELQASNEELQASNEELQAVNEELITLSAEHERKIRLLSELNQQTEYLLGILKVGVIFVDEDLQIARFSRLLGQFLGDEFSLQDQDIGRSLRQIGPRLDGLDLPKFCAQVIADGGSRRARAQHEGHDLEIEVHALPDTGSGASRAGAVVLFRNWEPQA